MDELFEYIGGPQPDSLRSSAFDAETLRLAAQVLWDRQRELATPEGRWALFVDIARIGADRNFHAISSSPYWRTYVALASTVGSVPRQAAKQTLALALQRAERDSFIASMTSFYSIMFSALGLRLRHESMTIEQLVVASAAAVEGVASRQFLLNITDHESEPGEPLEAEGESTLLSIIRQTIPADAVPGSSGPWSLAAFGYLGVMNAFLEIDPDAQPVDLEALGVRNLMELRDE